MAHHKSAKKRIRRNERARVRNKQSMSSVRTAIKAFRAAVNGVLEGTVEKDKLAPLYSTAQSMLSRAAKKGIMHSNTASRRIGRLALTLDRTQKAEVAAADAGTKKATTKKTTTKKKTTKKKAAKKKTSKKS